MTPIDLLKKANARGEIGYAYGGKDDDLPAVREAEARGWIVYHQDASVGGSKSAEGGIYKRRDIYKITDSGRAALRGGMGT